MPEIPDPSVYAAVLAVMLICSALNGVTGFGFGTLAMTVLPFVMDTRLASVLVSLVSLVAVGYVAWQYGSNAHRPTLLGLVTGSLVGVPLGVHWLSVLPETALRRAIGVAVVGYCLYHVSQTLMSKAPDRRAPGWLAVPVGLVGGALSGAVNMAAPPTVRYVFHRMRKREVIVGTLSVYFVLLSTGKVCLMFWKSMIPASLAAYAPAIALIWLGSFVGVRIGRRLRPELFRHIVAGTLAVLGLLLLLSPSG